MRKSARQLNKVLDSLITKRREKSVFSRLCSVVKRSNVKDGIVRVTAMSLALLLLLSTAAGSISNSIT